MFRSNICLQNKDPMALGVPFGHGYSPLWFFPQKKPVVSRCNQPFHPWVRKRIPYRPRTNLSDLIGVENPVLPIRIRWMEISLPSTRAPAVAPDTLILVQPSQVRKFTTWFHMIPWFGVSCLPMSLSMYMLHHNLYLHYPYHLHVLDPHFEYFLIPYQASKGSKFFVSSFHCLVEISLEQKRNHPTLTSTWVEPACEVATQESSYA